MDLAVLIILIIIVVLVLTFINRLSDYFFVIARVLNVRHDQVDVPYERSEKVFHVSKETRDADKD